MKKIDRSKIKRMLVITLSNLGDVILTTPVVETLLLEFPDAKLDVVVGPNGKEVFATHPKINDVILYNKKASVVGKFNFFISLFKNRYNLVVDLRNTVLPFVLGARYTTSPFRHGKQEKMHKKDAHLSRLADIGITSVDGGLSIFVQREEKDRVDSILSRLGGKRFIVVSAGAKSHVKRWPIKYFAKLCDLVKRQLDYEIVLVGDKSDRIVVERVLFYMDTEPVNLSEKLNIRELAHLIERSRLLITNDSAPLHVGSAVGSPILTFFGPTDENKYGPLTKRSSSVLRKNIQCAPCEVAQCVRKENKYECLKAISAEEAFQAARELLQEKEEITNSRDAMNNIRNNQIPRNKIQTNLNNQ